MKAYKSFSELNMSDRINVQNEVFNYLDDSRSAWDDKEVFYASTADDFEPSYVDEAFNDEGDSLGKCIIISNRIAIEYNKENWAEFSQIFSEALAKVKNANEE